MDKYRIVEHTTKGGALYYTLQRSGLLMWDNLRDYDSLGEALVDKTYLENKEVERDNKKVVKTRIVK